MSTVGFNNGALLVGDAATSRTNLGLGSAAVLAASQVAQTANNLSDLTSAATARTNLGITGAGTMTLPVTVPNGGTGNNTLTSHGVLVGAGVSAVSQLAAGTAGQVLQSGGASADPAYSTATYPLTAGTSGKVLISDGTNIVSSTPTYPNVASTALKHIKSDGTNFVTTTVTYPDASVTAGKVIISDGTNYIASTPTFPNASASSGKFIRSDGTNWIASTPTLPTSAGTSGKVLQSDATNYVESTATFPSTATGTGTLLRADGTNWVATTSTYPNTNAVSTLLYASSANVMSALATANNGVLITSNTGVPSLLAETATAGIPLVSGGTGVPPAFTTAVVAGGGTGVTSFTTYMPIAGGTSTTGALQSVATGSAGQVLKYVSSSALPVWATTTSTFNYTGTAVSYQVLVTDYIIGVTTNAAARTITMPNSGMASGQSWVIKDEAGTAQSANNITISGNGANIDGSATFVINTNFGSATLYFNGTNFFVI